MRVVHHLILSAIFAAILYPLLNISTIFVFLAGWMIDIDHLLFYWWEQGFSFNILKINKNYVGRRRKFKHGVYVGHSMEFLMIVTLISLVNNWYAILIGIIFHLAIDMFIDQDISKFSIIQWWRTCRVPN